MTIKLFGFRIEITKVTKQTGLSVDREQAARDAAAIKNDPKFSEIKARAAALRAARA